MIGAAQKLRHSARSGRNSGSVVAAHIVKSPQLLIGASNYDKRFACQIEGEELAGLGYLIMFASARGETAVVFAAIAVISGDCSPAFAPCRISSHCSTASRSELV